MTGTGYDPAKWGVPLTTAKRSIAFNVVRAGDFAFVTADGYEVTFRIKLLSVSVTGQKDADGLPLYDVDFQVEPSIRPMLDDADASNPQ